MKKSIVLTALIVGGFSLLSFNSSENADTKIQKSKLYPFWLKLECTKTYPSGTVTGNRCVIGGPLLNCTEVNPDCNEIIGS